MVYNTRILNVNFHKWCLLSSLLRPDEKWFILKNHCGIILTTMISFWCREIMLLHIVMTILYMVYSRILTPSKYGWCCFERSVIQYRCPTNCTPPSITSGSTEFNLWWPTPLVKSVYSDHHSSVVAPVTISLDPRPNIIPSNLCDHKVKHV